MTREEYDAISAINASFLKECAKSAYNGWMFLNHPKPPSDEMDLGSGIHAMLLEADQFFDKCAVIPEDAPKKLTKPQIEALEKFPTLEKPTKTQITANERSTKTGAWWKGFDAANTGKIILDQDEYQKIVRIKDKCLAIPHVAEALKNFKKEESATWDHPIYGKMKCRFDLVNWESKVFVDIKSTRDADSTAFVRQLIQLRYDIQMRHYWEAVGGDGIYVVAIESETEQVACYDIFDIVTSDFTDRRYKNALEVAAQVRQMTECPPKFKPEIVNLTLPKWAIESEAV